ncbi:protein phosphatase 2C domain-containing protein [Saccharothrix sp. ST-888]|uniref:protein phosphatase 2C domain-containing protein n=1 Tax=Saccharothrix sp. ST-888 TaxID=1427391 RepID=UPI0007C7BB10|nr:protein phosphatase 2C domain-containing protein [Saccharothrix sp. ST-888]
MPQQTVCPSCAEPLEPEDVFCGACGRSLNEPEPEPEPAPEASPEAAPRTEAAAPPSCVHCGSAELTVEGYCESCGGVQPRPRDHQERSLAGVAGVTDRGLRHHRNEDAFTVAATSLPGGEPAVVAVVCDGVSSSARPDEASAAAVDAASESLLTALEQGEEPEAAMRGAIEAAAHAVSALAQDGPLTPGGSLNAPACTYVSAISAAGRITIGWVGDTRAYWIPDDRVSAVPYRLTEDDSWAARVVAAGLMGEAEAYADPRAHAITGWLGADAEELEPHTVSFTPHVPGVLLVCTDGLWNYAEAATDLAFFVRADARTDPLAAAQALVRFAVTAGGHDNITVAVLPIDPPAIEPAPTLVDFQPFRTLPDQPSPAATGTAI